MEVDCFCPFYVLRTWFSILHGLLLSNKGLMMMNLFNFKKLIGPHEG